ncbi:MAG: response regulator [Dehalococcoidales bacterium]|jgi:DNA-binding response OmpR family regulator|nr:response regulator [Dehalococcoidales bacterium]
MTGRKSLLAFCGRTTSDEVRQALNLCEIDCDFYCSSSAELFIDKVNSMHPDVIILGSDASHNDIFKLIHRTRAHSQAPFIFISNILDEYEKEKAVKSGASACIKKPFRDIELITCVRSFIG